MRHPASRRIASAARLGASPLLLLLLLLLLAASSCDGCGERGSGDPTRETPAREPAPAPEGLAWEISIGGGAETLRALRAALPPGRARLLVPETPGELVDRMIGGLELGGRISDDATFHTLSVQVMESTWNVSAVRVAVDPDPAPLGASIALYPGAPFDGSFIGAVPGDDDEAAVLVDDVLVFGERRAAVERAVGYLAFTRIPAEVPDGISFRGESSVAGDARLLLDQLVRRTAGEARAAVAEERLAHQTPPDFGDPEALIDLVEASLFGWIALLPDVGEVRATVTPTEGALGSGLSLDAELDVREGSPLSALLAETSVGDAAPLASLPVGTSVAWLFRSAHHEPEASFVADLAHIGGDRVDARERMALDVLGESLSSLGDGARFVALGGAGGVAFALYGVESPTVAFDRDALSGAARGVFVNTVLSRAFGCSPARAGTWTGAAAPSDDTPDSLTSFVLCGDRSLFVRAASDTVAIGASKELPTAATSASRPDVGRALIALGDQLVFAAVLIPSRIIAAAPLVELGPLAAMAARLDAGGRDAPIALGLSKRPGGVRLRIVATTNAIEDALTLSSAFE